MRIIKVSIKFNRILSNRGGRFLTVYNGRGEKINGKVLTTWLFWAKVQHAKTKQTSWVKNYKVDLVVADKAVHF